jgi:imidazole glycerol phosphate synthase subunit HisF
VEPEIISFLWARVLHEGASAVAVVSIFHFTEQTLAEAKVAMKCSGMPFRYGFQIEVR